MIFSDANELISLVCVFFWKLTLLVLDRPDDAEQWNSAKRFRLRRAVLAAKIVSSEKGRLLPLYVEKAAWTAAKISAMDFRLQWECRGLRSSCKKRVSRFGVCSVQDR